MSDNIIIKKLPSGSAEPATPSEAGIVKLYDSLGSNTDGTINQSFISEEITNINDTLDSLAPPLILDKDAQVTAEIYQEINDAFEAGKQICITGENGLVYLSTQYGEPIVDPGTGDEVGYVGYLIFAEGKEYIYFLEIEIDENDDFVRGAWFFDMESVIPDITNPETFSETLNSLNQVILSRIIDCDSELVGDDIVALIVTTQVGQSNAYYFRYDENDNCFYADMYTEFSPNNSEFIYLNESGFSSETEIPYSQVPLLACTPPETWLKQYRFGSPQSYVSFKTASQDRTHFIFEGTINNNLVTVDIEVDWENHSAQVTQTSTEIGGNNVYEIIDTNNIPLDAWQFFTDTSKPIKYVKINSATYRCIGTEIKTIEDGREYFIYFEPNIKDDSSPNTYQMIVSFIKIAGTSTLSYNTPQILNIEYNQFWVDGYLPE